MNTIKKTSLGAILAAAMTVPAWAGAPANSAVVHSMDGKTTLVPITAERQAELLASPHAHALAAGIVVLVANGKTYVKLSAPYRISEAADYSDVEEIAIRLIAANSARMLWGSDWPHVNMNGRKMPNDGDLLDLLLDWAPDAGDRRRILADNPAALYGMPAGAAGADK